MELSLSIVLVTLAVASPLKGFEKPVKEERGFLGESELAKGKVKIYCADVGRWMLVEINDPGLKGARDIWLRRKLGDAMPPCDANDSGVARLDGAAQFGYLAGIRGGYAFVLSSDSSSGFRGIRVYALADGALVYDGEFYAAQPISFVTDGKKTLLRAHVEIHARCQPSGEEATSCWKELRTDAAIPASVELTPPPCDALLKTHPETLGAMVAVPVEIDLSASKKAKFLDGAATCSAPE